MFTVTKTAPNRVDIVLQGQIDAVDMEAGLGTLFEYAKTISHGRMLYTITDFSMPTLSAIGVEMRHLPHMFGLLNTFDKCALVTDTAWLRTAAEVEGKLLPGLEIKSFDTTQTDAAEAWLL